MGGSIGWKSCLMKWRSLIRISHPPYCVDMSKKKKKKRIRVFQTFKWRTLPKSLKVFLSISYSNIVILPNFIKDKIRIVYVYIIVLYSYFKI
jgi:ribosomal protein S18